MAFLDPKKQQEDDELPGSSGLRLDLDIRICPECRRESLPWQEECPTCGVPTVAPTALPAQRFVLPDLDEDAEEDAPDEATDWAGDDERADP
jgi:rRNA maturation protein Nop10